jgi:hypothetical protein
LKSHQAAERSARRYARSIEPTDLADEGESSGQRNAQTISICTGHYDIVAWAVFSGVSDLQLLITSDLSKVAGLRYTETMTNLKLVKFSHRLLTE